MCAMLRVFIALKSTNIMNSIFYVQLHVGQAVQSETWILCIYVSGMVTYMSKSLSLIIILAQYAGHIGLLQQ